MNGVSPARVAAVVSLMAALTCSAADTAPYLGHWSNGRGDTLVVTKETIQFAGNPAVHYRDVTRVTDGAGFELEIAGRATMPGSGGKTVAVRCEGKSMQMTAYASHDAYMQGGEVLSEVQWERDPAPAETKSGTKSHTPPADSAERKAIALAIHPPCERDLKQDVLIRFDRLVVVGDWAAAGVRPLQPNGEPIDYRQTSFKGQLEAGMFDATGEVLLRRKKGEWKVLEWAFGRTDTALATWLEKHKAPAALTD